MLIARTFILVLKAQRRVQLEKTLENLRILDLELVSTLVHIHRLVRYTLLTNFNISRIVCGLCFWGRSL